MRLYPKTITGQLVASLFIVLIFAQAVNLILLVGERRITSKANTYNLAIGKTVETIPLIFDNLPEALPYDLPPQRGLPGAFFISKFNRSREVETPTVMPRLEARLRRSLSDAGVNPLALSVVLNKQGPRRRPYDAGAERPPGPPGSRPQRPPRPRADRPNRASADGRFRPPSPPDAGRRAPGMQELVISVELQDGIWFNALVPHYPTNALTPRILIATSILLLLTLLVAGWFIRRISRPYAQFAHAADKFGRGGTSVTLPESGPEDVRNAAIAFNIMQDRLSRTIEGQRMMLRAIGHDLRTPLTSMRISAEELPRGGVRTTLIESIDDMSVMTNDILSWAKDMSAIEPLAKVSLGSLLDSLVNDYSDAGHAVSLGPSIDAAVSVRRVALKRALRNVIDNALNYAGSAQLSSIESEKHFRVFIDDDGPGIPQESLTAVLDPFVRIDPSRNSDLGGTGLGLSIANAILQADGGRMDLSNRVEGGLRVTFLIPKINL